MTNIKLPFLHTIKCSDCQIYIDIRTLDSHVCTKETDISSLNVTSPTSTFFHQNKSSTDSRKSREKSKNGLNNSMRRILQKMKGNTNEQQNVSNTNSTNSSLLSPTFSTFTASTSSIITPRSSEDYFQQYFSKQENNLQLGNEQLIVKEESYYNKKENQEPLTTNKNDDLESIINHLINKLSNSNSSTVSLLEEDKTTPCAICHKAITMHDEMVKNTQQGHCYHQSCYCCSLCRVPLSNAAFNYYGKLYCSRDYGVMKSRDNKSTVEKKKGMPKSCYECNKEFEDEDYMSYKIFKNRIYCKSDFNRLFLPKCPACTKPVEREAISALDGKLDGKWHLECFNCQICHESFPDNIFYVFNNQPYCKRHYHFLNNSLCNRCHEGIENLCAHTAEGWRFHPECFTCEICQVKLDDTYYVFENRIYCETHIRRQFTNNDNYPLHKRRTQLFDLYD
ncbi:MAG: hypothetical protein EXX96DRAFT_590188 [Benjaminiella poitrasii]|nr:MAG: hypothetical protein EXX96DRAFT_590188 [Benjaminiella poitrasii]